MAGWSPTADLVTAMFGRHGVSASWQPMPARGLANHVYATRDVVLRVATDHPEGIADARTESVAAPVAHAAGVLTPRLIAFDDSRTLVDRPFSLWERVHGETLGLVQLNRRQISEVWSRVGRELAKLHLRVRKCPDPNDYLDQPERDLSLGSLLTRLVDADRVIDATAKAIEQLAKEIGVHVTTTVDARFIHNDVHPMNVMCSTDGALLAVLDWGDAGWGDPTLDFATIPLEAIPFAVQGYQSESPDGLGDFPEARFIWDKLLGAMEDMWETPGQSLPLGALQQLLRSKTR
jgi:aminoglycoside phosphotransferase (APT) family kinase protein